MSNTGSVSTTFVWKRVKIRCPPEASPDRTPKGSRWRKKPKRNSREPLTVKLKNRGGPEAWVEVSARGETNYYPGYTQICDIVRDLNSGG